MKPILFSSEMVRAILEGRKTQTRRVIKPHIPGEEIWEMKDAHIPYVMDSVGPHYPPYAIREPGYDYRGMILWVRETWRYCADNGGFCYKASQPYTTDHCRKYASVCEYLPKWRPSIHMPRTAARIFLRVTDVRVERLQEISEADIIKEGCPNEFLLGQNWYRPLWNKLNTKRGYSWESNPRVWVIEFERVEKPEGVEK